MAKRNTAPVFNIEDTDPYLDAEAGAWLHLEDRRVFPAVKLYADGAEKQLPVRIKLLGMLAHAVQEKAAEINKRASALQQERFDAAKAGKKDDAEAKKAAALTDDEVAQFDAELYAAVTVDSENLGFKGQAKLTPELAQELYSKRADIRAQVREFLGKPAEFMRVRVVH